MRAVLPAALAAGLALAGPAAGQLNPQLDTLRMHELQMQQDLMRQRQLSQELEMQALDNRLRTEQSLRDVQTQRALPPLPTLPDDAKRPSPVIDTSKLASMPDDRLAASNAAVREASEARR
jgi:TolA-binding protein